MPNNTELQWLLDKQLQWITTADGKLAILGSLPVAMLALSFVHLKSQLEIIGWADIPLALSTFFLFCTLFFVSASLVSRLNGPSSSNVFFGRIAERSREQFCEDKKSESNDAQINDLLAQIHVNAEIALTKHKNVGRAVWCLIFATPMWLLTVALGNGFVIS